MKGFIDWVSKRGLVTTRRSAGVLAWALGFFNKDGNFADVVVFDPETIEGRAACEDPFHYSVGMQYVLSSSSP